MIPNIDSSGQFAPNDPEELIYLDSFDGQSFREIC
jgi:hypothetical protein